MNRYLARREKRRAANYHGRVSERLGIKSLGGRLTPASGSLDGAKSDGATPEFQIEHKSTVHKSYGLKLSVLKKIEKEALAVGKSPVLSLSFVNGSGESISGGDFIIIPRSLFQELVCR